MEQWDKKDRRFLAERGVHFANPAKAAQKKAKQQKHAAEAAAPEPASSEASTPRLVLHPSSIARSAPGWWVFAGCQYPGYRGAYCDKSPGQSLIVGIINVYPRKINRVDIRSMKDSVNLQSKYDTLMQKVMIIPRTDFSCTGSAGEACNPFLAELHDSAEFYLGDRCRHHSGASSA